MGAQRQRDELLRLRAQVAGLRDQWAERRRLAAAANTASTNGVPLDAPGTFFRFAEIKDVGTRTPMTSLQTREWAARTGNAERFRALWVEAANVSEREKKRGVLLRDRMFTRLSSSGLPEFVDYQEVHFLQMIPSEDQNEFRLMAQLRGTAGRLRFEAPIRRVGDEWRFVMLMSPNELTPSIPE
jgi:hypothetical protein